MIVYNPMAGRFPSKPMVDRAADVLRSKGWEIHIERTHGADHTTSLAKQAVEDSLDAIFVAGGDGSINRTVAGLTGGETALGVLPAGTANVWAQELGLPILSWTNLTALERSARMLAEGQRRLVDVGMCRGIPYLLWAGVGFDAFVVHHIEPRSRWEKNFAIPQYAANAAWFARKWQGMEIQIIIEEEVIEGTYLLALITNVRLYAGGIAEISPSAKIDDGKMDLWLFSGTTLAETVRHMWMLYSGQHFDAKKVKHFSCQKAEFHSNTPLYLQVDGEPLPESEDAVIEIKPQALQVMVPKTSSHELFSEEA
jgi:YegS/Rv2252/BmrU family lipid kinase